MHLQGQLICELRNKYTMNFHGLIDALVKPEWKIVMVSHL